MSSPKVYTRFTILLQDNQLFQSWTQAGYMQKIREFLQTPENEDGKWEIRYPSPPGEWEILHSETKELIAYVFLSQEVR